MKRGIEKYSENELVSLLREGNEKAFKELFFRFEQKILLYLLRFTRSKEVAEEILQDIFMRIWEYRESLDISLSFKALVYKIAKNSILNYLRSEAKNLTLRKEYSLSMDVMRSTTEDKIFFDDYIRMADCAIDQLSTKRKSIFRMSRYDGKSYDEIATAMGISKNTVRIQMVRSLKDIKKYMITNADISSSLFILFLFVR